MFRDDTVLQHANPLNLNLHDVTRVKRSSRARRTGENQVAGLQRDVLADEAYRLRYVVNLVFRKTSAVCNWRIG